MEQIRRKPLSEIPELALLQANWEQWGREFETYLLGGKSKGVGVDFSWSRSQGIYGALRNALAQLTQEHCTFCDGFPVGTVSKKTVEHYEPKYDFPLKAYKWENLFYCCDRCQSEANRDRPFRFTLKPDEASYTFDCYFYFDLSTGKLNVMENLSIDDSQKAMGFLERYGINNNPERCQSRQHRYWDIKHALSDPEDGRTRNDFPYRFVYDCVRRDLDANLFRDR